MVEELTLAADSNGVMREWLEAIRTRLSTLGADANNPTPAAPPRSHEKPAAPPRSRDKKPKDVAKEANKEAAKEALLPQNTARSDDARASQARWLSAQEALDSDDPEAAPVKGMATKPAKITEYVACPGGWRMRATHVVVLVWLLGAAALAEGAYIVLRT